MTQKTYIIHNAIKITEYHPGVGHVVSHQAAAGYSDDVLQQMTGDHEP